MAAERDWHWVMSQDLRGKRCVGLSGHYMVGHVMCRSKKGKGWTVLPSLGELLCPTCSRLAREEQARAALAKAKASA